MYLASSYSRRGFDQFPTCQNKRVFPSKLQVLLNPMLINDGDLVYVFLTEDQKQGAVALNSFQEIHALLLVQTFLFHQATRLRFCLAL